MVSMLWSLYAVTKTTSALSSTSRMASTVCRPSQPGMRMSQKIAA